MFQMKKKTRPKLQTMANEMKVSNSSKKEFQFGHKYGHQTQGKNRGTQ